MCESHSESGQPCGFSPCEAYQRLAQENEELRRDATEVLIKKMTMEHGEFELQFESNPLLLVMGEWALRMLKDAPNFLTTLIVHAPSGEGIILTLQRQNGESPAEQLARYKAENAALRQERDRLAGIVEEADALAPTPQSAPPAGDGRRTGGRGWCEGYMEELNK